MKVHKLNGNNKQRKEKAISLLEKVGMKKNILTAIHMSFQEDKGSEL